MLNIHQHPVQHAMLSWHRGQPGLWRYRVFNVFFSEAEMPLHARVAHNSLYRHNLCIYYLMQRGKQHQCPLLTKNITTSKKNGSNAGVYFSPPPPPVVVLGTLRDYPPKQFGNHFAATTTAAPCARRHWSRDPPAGCGTNSLRPGWNISTVSSAVPESSSPPATASLFAGQETLFLKKKK